MTPDRETPRTLTLPMRRPHHKGGAALTWCFQTLLFYLVLAIFGVVFLGWSLFATPAYWLIPRRLSAPFGQYMLSAGARWLLAVMEKSGLAQFDLAALDTLQQEGGLVIVPNHPTLIDVLLVASRLPRVVCITKAAIWHNPLCGGAARLAGYIRNDTPHTLVRAAAAAIGAGNQLLIFPEGTRTRTPPVGPFKAGFVLMARQAGVPIQTVLLQANPPYLAKGWSLFRRPEFPIVYRARLGRRFTVEGSAQAFSDRLHAYFAAELDRR
jgi:1-acyl-sn-glycerol-3-phosphate acyltransferase